MSRVTRMLRIAAAASALLALALTGCGTSMNSAFSSPSGTIQPQSKPATGPILGYVWDATGAALRPVQGVPGASIVGAALISAPSAGAGFIANASSSVSGAALFLDANGGVFTSPLTGAKLIQIASLPGATNLYLSHSGAYALVTGKNASGVTIASVISGLPQSPSVRALDASTLGAILGGAASDTGTVALAGSGQSGVSFVAYSGQGAGAQVATAQGFGGMQFVPGSDELVVGDASSGTLTAISQVNTAPSSATLSPAGGIASPVALDVTPNGRWVVAANHAGDVLRVDLTGAIAATKVHCSCAPSQVVALSGNTVHLVTAGAGPLWIVDAGNSAPRVLFVPAISPSAVATIVTKSAM